MVSDSIVRDRRSRWDLAPRIFQFALSLVLILVVGVAAARIPALPVMTLYRFNGATELPYYELDRFLRDGPVQPAGRMAQGTTVIPCLVIRRGVAVTDQQGTPFVGFEIVQDARAADQGSAERVRAAIDARRGLRVHDHHCPRGTRYVLDVRNLYAMDKAPHFDPPAPDNAPSPQDAGSVLIGESVDAVVRAFHQSRFCGTANARLVGRRQALISAWDAFSAANGAMVDHERLRRARQLDFVMRTGLFEAHLGRGCSAYGACERNIVALSIRNRGLERCLKREGCRAPGDFEGVASAPSQYNIWDEYLGQVSALTACYLRDDLAGLPEYTRLRAMYEQSAGDVERILFGSDRDLAAVFPGNDLAALKRLAHYYHAPAMGKCFPEHPRVEFMSGAVARKGGRHALIANVRIEIGERTEDGYRFRAFSFREEDDRDVVDIRDDYRGFIVDPRKVTLAASSNCVPYGIPAGCNRSPVERYRRTPFWLAAGQPLGIACVIADRAESCAAPARQVQVEVGGSCDTQMRPVSGVR